jgi:AraC-like DNA-binding protein
MSNLRMTALARVPEFLLKWAEEQGADGDALAERAGMDRGAFVDPDARIPITQLWNLWRVMIEEFPDPDLGLTIGGLSNIRDFGLVGYTILYSPTLAEALHQMARYSRIVNEITPFVIRESSKGSILVSESFPRFDLMRHPVDIRLAWALTAVREAVGSKITPVETGFPYRRPASIAKHTRLFRSSLKFDQPEASLVFRSEDLSLPVVAGDPVLVRYLDQLADKVLESLEGNTTFSDQVRKEIWSDLSSGKTTLKRVASRLGVSSRSLQRRLTEDSTTFGAELESIRSDMARRLLKDQSLAVCELAFLLGYSEPSSFYRAFRRWEHVSPDAYRRAHRRIASHASSDSGP